jgi:uncharacterized membrane protein YdjX (TVP38/TMEM64 family)
MKRQPRRLIWAAAKLAATIALLVILGLLARRYNYTFATVSAYLRTFDPLESGIVLALAYALVSIIPVPLRDLLKFVAAAVFGALASTALIWIGEMIAAVGSFWISRAAGKDLIDQLFGQRLAPFNEKLDRAGWRTIMWLRILPVTPYRYFNFAAGLVELRFGPYLAGSAIGMLLRTAFYQTAYTQVAKLLVAWGITTWQLVLASVVFVVVVMSGLWWYTKRKPRATIEVESDER